MKLGKTLFFFAVCFLLAGMALSFAKISNITPALAQIDTYPILVIDPGHGGADGGAVGSGGVVEKEINLAISLKLKEMLVSSGFEVILTRESDISIHDDGLSGTKNQKTSDIHNRLDILESTPHAVLLSIHQNKFNQSSCHGAQVWYSANNESSQTLAQILQKNFINLLQPDNTREIKKGGRDYYILNNATHPAVLVECGFLSNPSEAQKLSDENYQQQVAFAIYCSILEFVQTGWNGNGISLEENGIGV